jgi:hypothetical protein
VNDDDKRRFDALMQLVDHRMKRVVSRRDHEWKVTIGLWALLGAGLLQLRTEHIWFLVGGLVILVVVHVMWTLAHQIHSREDIEIGFHYHDRAVEVLQEKSALKILIGTPNQSGKRRDDSSRIRLCVNKSRLWRIGAWLATVITTLLLALGVALVNAYQ